MKRKMKRLLGILLSLALILGLVPGMSLTTYAATDTYTNLMNNKTVVKFNNHDWYIIADDSTNTGGTLTLLAADTSFGTSVFSSNGSNAYSSSTVKGVLDALTAEGGAFASVKRAIADTDLSDVSVTGAKLYLLSEDEAGPYQSFYFTGVQESGGWWLRTPRSAFFGIVSAACVNGQDGVLFDHGGKVGDTFGVRPALKLKLSSVSFSSSDNTFSLKSHEHDFTYAAEGATITATCGEEDCYLDDGQDHHTATLTIGAPADLAYTGTAKAATITDDEGVQGTATVLYYNATKSGDTYTKSSETELNSAPVNVGDYIAEITIGGATAFVGYSITKKTNTTGQISTETLSGNITKSNTSITIGSTSSAYEYIVVAKDATPNWAGATPGTGNAMTFDGLSAGTGYDVYVRAKGDDNTEPGEATKVTLTTNVTVAISGTPTQGQGGISVTTNPVKEGVTYRWYIGTSETPDGTGTTIVPSQGGGVLKVEVLLDGEVIGTSTTGTTEVTTLAKFIENANNPVAITLDGPVTGGISIPTNKTVTLDINGQEIDGGISVAAESTLTINDSSNPQKGTVKGTVTADATGTIIIKGGRYENTPTGTDRKTIKGGLFSADPKELLKPPYKVGTSGDNTYTHKVYNAYTALTDNNVPTISITKAVGNTDGDTPQIGDTLTASSDAYPVSYQWYRIDGQNETLIEGARSENYTLTLADVGKVITVKATQAAGANDNDDNPSTVQTQTSAATVAVEKKTNQKTKITETEFLKKITKTGNSITITSDSNYEYAVVPKSDTTYNWANPAPKEGTGNALTFGGNEQPLSPGTDYDVYVRAKAYDEYQPGKATKIIVSTDVEVTIGGTPAQGQSVNVTLTPNKGGVTYKWYIGGSTTPDGEGTTIVPSKGGATLKVEVYAGNPEAKIGEATEANIKTLAQVISDMQGDSVTITLAGKITGDITIPGDKNVKLNLNGQTVTGDITVPATSTLTINDTSDAQTGTVTGTVKSETGEVTIIGGRYDKKPTKTEGGRVTIKGGVFKETPATILADTDYGIKELSASETYKYKVLPNPTISSAPQTPQGSGLTYTGSSQALVTKPTVQNGTVYFAFSKTNSQPEFDGLSEATDKNWTTSIPTAKEVGTYYVWYRVIGDATHADSNVVSMDAIKIKPGAPKVTDLRANEAVFDYTNGIFKQNSNYQIYVGAEAPESDTDPTTVPSGGYDLLENIVDLAVNNDDNPNNDVKLYVRMVDESDKSDWVYVPLPKRQSTSGIVVDYNKDTISGVYNGVKYSTNVNNPSTAWENGSSDLTKAPISWTGSSMTLKFMVPGDQDNQLFPSKVKEISLGTKGDAPAAENLNGYPIAVDNISYRNATLPTSKDSNKKLQYSYKKQGTSEWTSWGYSNKAIGLDMGTKYDYEVRFAPGTDSNGKPTPASKALSGTFTTKITSPDINDILDRYIDYNTRKFTNPPEEKFEYALTANAESTAWTVCANENDVPGGESGFYIRYKNAGNGQPSAATFIPAATIPADVDGVRAADEAVSGLGGSFTGTNNSMEYRYNSSAWTSWIPCTSNMTGLAAGEYQIRKKASGSGLPSFAKQFIIGAGRPATITVTVKDSAGDGILDATVKATIAGNAGSTNSTNKQDGTYTITGLSAGTYQIIATGIDGHEVTSLLTITSAEHAVDITLPTGKENSSKLVDNTGNNIAVGGIDDQAKALDTKSGETDKEYLVSFKAEEKSEADPEIAAEISGINEKAEADATYRDSENKPVDVQKEFLDFSVEKTLMSYANGSVADVGETTKITKTDRVMEIIYPYPEMNTRFGIMVWRYHESAQKFSRLESRPTTPGAMRDATYYIDRLEKRLYIYGDLFSTYSITYAENADIKDPATGNPGGGSGGGGGTPTPSYTPTITNPDHGTISISPEKPEPGETVTITVTPDEGYETDSINVTDKDGNPVTVTKNSDGTYVFTQPPTGPVTIEAVVKTKDDTTPVVNKPKHGTVTVSPEKPAAGETVVITVTPEEGYETDTVTVTDKDGNTVPVTKNADGTYSFVQPESGNVTIGAVLRLKDGVIITFDLNGKKGTAPDAQTVKKGEKASRPNAPAAEGYTFTGWFTDTEGKNAYDFDTPVNEDLILYAGWEKNAEPGPGPVPGPEDEDFGIYFVELFDDPYEGVCYNDEKDRYEIVYTGEPIRPAIKVTSRADGVLSEGVDYKVSYGNNRNVSTKKPMLIKVTGKGTFKDTKILELYILPVDLEEAESHELLTGADEISVASGKKVAPVLIYRGYQLKSSDYDLSSKTAISTDTTINITGKKNFTGTLKEVPVKVITAVDNKANTIKVALKAGSHIYNGEEQELSITSAEAAGELTVTAGKSKTPLEEGTDFTVTYSSNVNAGTAKVTIKGIGDKTGTVVKTFKIQPDKNAVINAELSDPDSPIYYNARGEMPDITVEAQVPVTVTGLGSDTVENLTAELVDPVATEGVTLVQGRDYSISYSNNKKVGTGTYIVKFTGNYKGHAQIKNTFKIDPASVDEAKVEAAQLVYGKSGKYLSKPFVSVDGVQLKTSDYTFKYYEGEITDVDGAKELTAKDKLELKADETEKTITIAVTAKNNYTGTAFGTYEVKKPATDQIDLSKAKIVAKAKSAKGKDVKVGKQEYTGTAIEPEIRVLVKSGSTWTEVDDSKYEISYINNVLRGKATILITGDGTDAVGSRTAFFTITNMRMKLFKLIFG